MIWPAILKNVIVGTERSPLPESGLNPFGLTTSGHPAQTALEALSAANLVRKAGFQLAVAAGDSSSRQPAAPDARPVCPAAVSQDLDKIMSGLHAEALPEFLDLLAKSKFRLPPEVFPDLLEKAERDPVFAQKTRLALGGRGEWLARQNPRWSSLLAEDAADWFTASFAERKQLLRQTRARNPLLALAWLEKTWPEEKSSHKAQFLDILHIRLSPADEDLLEKAFSEKNRDVRWAAIRLLALLPESRKFAEAKAFFKERLAAALPLSKREGFLEKSLPDISEAALQPWLTLLLAATKGQPGRTGGWRNELLSQFVGLLPPAELLSMSGLSREQMLQSLDDGANSATAAALLEAIARHADASWTEPVLRHFSRDFRHTAWHSSAMMQFLTSFAPETMAFLRNNNIALDYENERILRALENCRRPWPKDLLDNLLEQYHRSALARGAGIPGWHYALALQVAAYHCSPADAMSSEMVRAYLQNPLASRPRELEAFLAILRFRHGMRGHFEPAAPLENRGQR